ncbi:MAG: YraN family protein [Eubacteriales bacterium]|nr:YraN family protein [Eubacteriales bacterium]
MNKRTTGAQYEELAAEFLEKKGCRIIDKNFRIRSGEIDLIVRDGRYLVFVEVKYRKNVQKGSPLAAVDARKQRVILQTAQYYLHRKGYPEDMPCRFDVIGICGEEIVHVKDAFWAGDF